MPLPPHPKHFAPDPEAEHASLERPALEALLSGRASLSSTLGISSGDLDTIWGAAISLAQAGEHERAVGALLALEVLAGTAPEIDLALAGCFARLGERQAAHLRLEALSLCETEEIRVASSVLATEFGLRREEERR